MRYTSPTSRSELRDIIDDAGGYYSYWDTAVARRCASCSINEGLAVHVSRAISPGHAAWEYFGYERRQYADVRQLESVMSRAVAGDLDRTGLGLRLRYLSGGMSDEARTVDRYVLPERAGYYLGARMCEPAIAAERPRVGGARERRRDRGARSRGGDDGVAVRCAALISRRRSVGTPRRARPRRPRRRSDPRASSTASRRCTAATGAGSSRARPASRNARTSSSARATA